ncbi:MAG: nucleotide exchange factor GrpE, partial [Halobacteriota archaeon]|nr:nucleotide exchange factor GrpE [Halobacteriota archaeon]
MCLSHIDAVGDKFDPYKHEAMMVDKNANLPEDTVTEELQKG